MASHEHGSLNSDPCLGLLEVESIRVSLRVLQGVLCGSSLNSGPFFRSPQ